mmetsp:Transcript_55008/g.80741  ORF Transcript_55008/g.80741 Transcript_55008/m.80741 type:complete len:93 (-) Transcript_55008:69-347(-)
MPVCMPSHPPGGGRVDGLSPDDVAVTAAAVNKPVAASAVNGSPTNHTSNGLPDGSHSRSPSSSRRPTNQSSFAFSETCVLHAAVCGSGKVHR